MTRSRDISSRFWNLPMKAKEETERELIFIDDIIQKAHIERTILSHLDGIETVFDGGAGYGRFSILLAKRGLKVTHFDISQPMIDRAKQLAAAEGVLERMTFVQGALEDLSAFAEKQFDMVLSFDAPISYTYPHQEEVISNLVRICAKRLVISVYSRLAWTYPFHPAQKAQYILDKTSDNPLVRWSLDKGLALLDEHKPDMETVWRIYRSGLTESLETTVEAFEHGKTPWPISYAFLPNELHDILLRNGAAEIELSGPGALSRSIPHEVLCNIMADPQLKADFLDFCYEYDSNPYCLGMSKDNLVATARI